MLLLLFLHLSPRYDQERWARIQADNAVMARKLGEVRREPPAGFHAPKGYKSVGQGRQAPGGGCGHVRGCGLGCGAGQAGCARWGDQLVLGMACRHWEVGAWVGGRINK